MCLWKRSGAAPVELVGVEINGSSVRLAFTRASTIALSEVVFLCTARRSTAKLRRVNLFLLCLAFLARAPKRLGSLEAENLANSRGVSTAVLIPVVARWALNRFLMAADTAAFLISAVLGLGPPSPIFAVTRLWEVSAAYNFFLIASVLRRAVDRERRRIRV